MSSVSPSPTSAAPVGSSGQPDPNGPSNTNPLISSQVALYLYTFLVTLVVLFALSAAIIARSCVLRRRHRQRMEEAVRRGTYVPSIPQKWKLGTKPAVHDVHLGRREEKNDTSLWSWHEIMVRTLTWTT
ncbi:hypothetical protein BC835DRAFT_962489 [Cytidiella melzeri]|nr:hypothetical protein BC835DRAFT_962489 [Cytidiella melzeri]